MYEIEFAPSDVNSRLGFDIKNMINNDKVHLMNTHPFFASLIQSKYIRVVPADDPYFMTAATDGRNIYINPLFMHSLSQEKRLFVYCHELWHSIFDTMARQGNRDPELFNIAADYSINQNLVDSGLVLPTQQDFMIFEERLVELIGIQELTDYYKKSMVVAKERGLVEPGKIAVMYDPRFKGMGHEVIYEILYQEELKKPQKPKCDCEKKKKDGDKDQNGQKNGEQKSKSKGGDEEEQSQDGDEDGGEGQGSEGEGEGQVQGAGGGCPKCGKGKGGGEGRGYGFSSQGTLDRHLIPGLSEAEKAEIQQETAQSAITARNSCKDRGTMPAGIAEALNLIKESKINWRNMLTADAISSVMDDYSWRNPHRSLMGEGITIPGMDVETEFRAAMIVDASGSMSQEDLSNVHSEIMGIARTFDSFTITMICFDTKLYNEQTFDSFSMDGVATYEFKGRGGTCFEPAMKWLEKKKSDEDDPFDWVVFFTDGYGEGWFEHMQYIYPNFVWLITPAGYGAKQKGPEPTWGSVIHYDPHD
jgi:predicted metal-dependent peptidase